MSVICLVDNENESKEAVFEKARDVQIIFIQMHSNFSNNIPIFRKASLELSSFKFYKWGNDINRQELVGGGVKSLEIAI